MVRRRRYSRRGGGVDGQHRHGADGYPIPGTNDTPLPMGEQTLNGGARRRRGGAGYRGIIGTALTPVALWAAQNHLGSSRRRRSSGRRRTGRRRRRTGRRRSRRRRR